mgnify:CR=1 FL=1
MPLPLPVTRQLRSPTHQPLLVAAALFFLFGLAAGKVGDWDLFWQLQSGKQMVAQQALLTTDTFSLAAESPRIEHCWLHDLIVYGVYALGGYVALSLWKGALVAGTALLLGLAARARGAGTVAILSVGLPAVLITHGAWVERPQLWSFLLFALFLWLLERFAGGERRVVWLLVPAMLLWANLHAAAILAAPLLLAYLVGEWAGGRPFRSETPGVGRGRLLLLVAALVALAGLITPYGPYLVKTLLAAPSLGDASGKLTQLYNVDWRSTSFARNPSFYYAMMIAAGIMLCGWQRIRLTDLLLLGGLALMGLRLERHTPFLLLGMAAILPVYLESWLSACRSHLSSFWAGAVRLLIGVSLVALTLWLARDLYQRNGFFDTGLVAMDLPVEAADYVRENRLPGNLFNSYDWGGYLMWALYPDYRVFWDGRHSSEELFRQGLRVMWEPDWEQVLDRFAVNTVVLKALSIDVGGTYPLHENLRSSPGWALVHADAVAMVFARRTAMPESWLVSNELPKERMDDTLLSQARYFTTRYPWRYKAWWVQAQVLLRRGNPEGAYRSLQQYLAHTPPDKRDPQASASYQALARRLNTTARPQQ